MKERLKMIFDRIDIFVVCIVIGLCFCIVEAFLGIWNMFADCFFITFLATECCYCHTLLVLYTQLKPLKVLIKANGTRKTRKSLGCSTKFMYLCTR